MASRAIHQDVREKQLTELAIIDGYTFVGWVNGYANSSSRAIISCPSHGEWAVTVNNFINHKSRCVGCQNIETSNRLKIPQDVRERQLRELAEADGYSFVGWVDGYRDAHSRVVINCPEHGDWSVAVDSFTRSGSRCSACKGMRNIPQDVRERQIKELADIDGYEFVGWVNGYANYYSSCVMNCPSHGEWSVTVGNFIRGSRCAECGIISSANQRRVSRNVCELRLIELANPDECSFIGWVGKYNGMNSKVTMSCSYHGEWIVSATKFVNQGSRCPTCGVGKSADTRRVPQDVRERQIVDAIGTREYTFEGWIGDTRNAVDRIMLKCAQHGQWDVTVVNFLSRRSGCPSCAEYGYQPYKPGTLYALLSKCEHMVKIGISNVPHQRHAQLANSTPFAFSTHRQLHCDDGTVPPMLERMFHDQFPSAELRGFDGATEWCRMSQDVTTWFDLLGAQ